MTCREAERLVTPYIRGELSDEQLEQFLEHIRTCPDCKEELEIYYTVEVGIQQLDEDNGNFNIKGALEETLEHSAQSVYLNRIRQIAKYAVTTLCVMSVLVSLALQLRIWWQMGIL